MSNLKKATCIENLKNGALKIEIDGEEVLLIQDKGAIYAISNVCSHQEKELSSGFFENGAWVCPHHGARFELKTGKPLSMPAVESIKTYKVVLKGNEIFIEMEEE
ncbi:MAG: non-heme iron oxygenase ferredoxin subunit [Acidobacteria bacterium]|nr:non-heme iron oxygenase ferredoxin subunit [Acidobacteriota bacterium]